MDIAEKENFEVLVWISATNSSTAIVKMLESPQYVVKSISRVWGAKFSMSKNFYRIDNGQDM